MTISINIDEKLLASYAFYITVALLKVFIMAFLTGRARNRTKTFANVEDMKGHGGKVGLNEDVERVRRAHLNDLENVVPFTVLAFVYMLTGPTHFLAAWHLRIFVGARIMHTIGYLNESHKVRGLGFIVGMLCCLSMGVQILRQTCCGF